jgi:hypothetical protein
MHAYKVLFKCHRIKVWVHVHAIQHVTVLVNLFVSVDDAVHRYLYNSLLLYMHAMHACMDVILNARNATHAVIDSRPVSAFQHFIFVYTVLYYVIMHACMYDYMDT